mgnify:CR=1 FL=1
MRAEPFRLSYEDQGVIRGHGMDMEPSLRRPGQQQLRCLASSSVDPQCPLQAILPALDHEPVVAGEGGTHRQVGPRDDPTFADSGKERAAIAVALFLEHHVGNTAIRGDEIEVQDGTLQIGEGNRNIDQIP